MALKHSVAITILVPLVWIFLFNVSIHYAGDFSDFENYVATQKTLHYLEAVISFVVYSFVVLFINHLIMRPVAKLNNSLEKICGGNFNVSFNGFKRDDEIGMLSCNLNKVLVSMKLAMYRQKK